MADWLRPVFGRSKTPLPLITSIETHDGIEADTSHLPRPKVASRVSSYLNLRQAAAAPSFLSTDSFPKYFQEVRNPQEIYHKPSTDQHVEMIKVVMMTQSSTQPIPVQYNSAILKLLEAYHDLQMDLRKKGDLIEEMKQSHEKDIKEFENLAKEWEEKRNNYKIELKKLEVLLSQTEDGLEKVTLARTKSTIHGAKASESIGRRVATIKETQAARDNRRKDRWQNTFSELETFDLNLSDDDGEKLLYPNFSERMPRKSRMDQTVTTARLTQWRSNTRVSPESRVEKAPQSSARNRFVQERSSNETFHSYSSPLVMRPRREIHIPDSHDVPRVEHDSLKRQQAEHLASKSFGSSASGSSTFRQPFRSRNHRSEGFNAHPTPHANKSSEAILINTRNSLSEGATFDLPSNKSIVTSERRFSFKAGDDNVLGSIDREPRDILYNSHKKATDPQPSNAPSKSTPRTSISPIHAFKDNQDGISLSRNDPTNSAVTAIRQNSGRSSKAGFERKKMSAQVPRAKSTGGSEAMTAAIKAFAGSSFSKIPQKSQSGSTGTSSRGSMETIEQVRKGDDSLRRGTPAKRV